MHKLMPSTFIDNLLKREYRDDYYKLNAKIVNDRFRNAKNFFNKDLISHYGCVNAVEFLNGGQFLVSGGDDQRVLLWNVQEALQGISKPKEMRAQHVSNIFCLGYDSKNTRLFSAGNDEQVIIHDIQTGEPVDVFRHLNPVYGLSVDPTNDFVFASACDDGSISIYDIREPASSGPFLLNKSTSAYHGVMHNPVEPRLLATANAKEGACLWDSRIPNKALLKWGGGVSGSGSDKRGCMAVRWSGNGSRLLALRRRLPAILFPVHSPSPIAQFDHPGYFNSCTMKSCCFAGRDDEYVLSGSDDFNLYMWKVPETDNDKRNKGTYSIHSTFLEGLFSLSYDTPNRNNSVSRYIWSPFPLPYCSGGLTKESVVKKKRKVFSHAEYLSLVYRGGQIIDHDYSNESTAEDPRMMAFFDSLVQREIECWTSTSDDSDKSHSETVVLLDRTASSGDEESEATEEEEDDESGERRKRRAQDLQQDSREDVHSPNPIVRLIARKRAQLCRVARRRNDAVDSSCPSSNNNNTASDVNDDNDNSSSSNSDTKDYSLVLFEKKQLLSRLLNTYSNSSDDDEEEDGPTPAKVRRRQSAEDTPGPSKVRRRQSVEDGPAPAKVRLRLSAENGLAAAKVRLRQSDEDSDSPATTSASLPTPPVPSSSRAGETPDSGIYVLSDEQTDGSFKKRSTSNRNYRRRILSSDESE
ncbi:DDB1- and CUL4-associated factor 5 [Nilaparvata lugens]|uniref:DDB1- and CUL4-associated factor 5 n=1 Tax=Nilaparvata lugens TaxID=108931 RepID=UPI00193EB475|nr:DDB1- and CUL4-associated factor 5 [Nilaparvata lugens]